MQQAAFQNATHHRLAVPPPPQLSQACSAIKTHRAPRQQSYTPTAIYNAYSITRASEQISTRGGGRGSGGPFCLGHHFISSKNRELRQLKPHHVMQHAPPPPPPAMGCRMSGGGSCSQPVWRCGSCVWSSDSIQYKFVALATARG